MQEIPFKFECPVTFFEKADAPPGRRRRIAGIISTENRDRQKEVVIQKGLDFTDFVNHGWYNDNHAKETTGVVGHPTEAVQLFKKGQGLPDGTKAPANCSWAEGYMLETERADKIWELGRALSKSGSDRRLGFSIEGGIERRVGANRKTIAKAKVRNVAITNCPVNVDTRLEVIAKSIIAANEAEDGNVLDKALTMGTATPGTAVAGTGPHTGEGAGKVLATQSLERKKPRKQLPLAEEADEEERKLKKKKKLSKAEALARISERFPHAKARTLARIYQTTVALKQGGRI